MVVRPPLLVGALAVSLAVIPLFPAEADPAPPPARAGFHNVKVGSGDQVGYVQVQNEATSTVPAPAANEPYRPERFDMRKTSSLAGKSYGSKASASSRTYSTDSNDRFPTKAYFPGAESSVDLRTYYYPSDTATYRAQRSSDFDKSFATKSADSTSRTAAFTKTRFAEAENASRYDQVVPVRGSKLGDKIYTGPEAEKARRDLASIDQTLNNRMKDVPNRPLTIDEVRGLLNHEIKPDLNSAPAPDSKPLNDPTYRKQPSPQAPARPARASALAPQENLPDLDSLPGPGEMAARRPVRESADSLPEK